MQRTKSKILSILLILAMLLLLLPTTALAADYNEVKVNGVSLGDGEYLTSNAATAASISSTKPSSYVAWYKDGTLTLNGYEGTGIVLQGAPAADLIIKLIGDNTITTTTHETGIQGNSAAGSITITADSGSNGNLTIDMTNSTRPVFGINGYANSVTIMGSADVKITAVATATNQESYGIKSSKAVSILENASVSITCKTPNSTSRSDSCNGIYSDMGVTIDTDGTIQIDVSKPGNEAYSYGINSMGTLTLTKVGGMTVKWKKAGAQGAPLLPSSASFDPTAYDTHMDTTDTTNCIATYMPKVATPTGNYSDSVRVYNANKKLIGLGDGECLTANDATGASSYTGGSSYVARYDKSSGTLYLKDYHGVAADGQIYAHGDLNIVVENDSSFTTSVSATNNLYGIEANGKLNISGSGKLTVTANGNGDVYGICANEGVTISAPLNVQVGKVDSSKNGPVYGIYTRSGAISLSGNDMTVTATGGTSTVYGVFNAAETETPAIADNGNIGISGTLTVNLSSGYINRGISSQGGVITLESATVKIPGSYRYGIFNRNGNVVIKSTSDVDISSDISDNNGICTYSGGDLTIENSAVKVSAHGYAANLEYGKLSIENSDVELTKTNGLVACVVNTPINAVNKIDLSGSGTVTLTAPGNQTSAMIGGEVTAISGTKLEKGTYYPGLKTYDGEYDGSSKTVLKFVHEAPASTADISVSGTIKSYNPGNTTTIQLMQDGKEMYSTTIAKTTGSGQKEQNFSFDAVAKGTYDLVVTKPGHLTYTIKNLVVGDNPLDLTKHSNAAINAITLLCGDIDGNGFINSTDLGIILKGQNYGKSTATAGDKAADLDGNGFINSTDLGIVLQGQHYGKSAVSVNFGE